MKFDTNLALGLAPLLGLACAFEETINGFKFIHTGPKTDAAKSVYEKTATDTALNLLTARLGSEGLNHVLDPEDDADNSRCLYLKSSDGPGGDDPNATDRFCLSLLKRKLGDNGLEDILHPDIADADNFWTGIVSRSNNGSWVSADASTYAFLPGLSAPLFALWTQSPLADKANNDANAEHYYKHTVPLSPTSMMSRILEGWGGTTTKFVVPDYSIIKEGKSGKYPMLRPMSAFLIQAAGGKTLIDGLLFGVLHICVRDVKGADHGSDIDGVEIAASVWYGDAMTDDHLEHERQHMVIEMVNLSIQAQKDITAGLLPPPI